MSGAIPIHPLDLFEMLTTEAGMTLAKSEGLRSSQYPQGDEIIEINGLRYIQDVHTERTFSAIR